MASGRGTKGRMPPYRKQGAPGRGDGLQNRRLAAYALQCLVIIYMAA